MAINAVFADLRPGWVGIMVLRVGIRRMRWLCIIALGLVSVLRAGATELERAGSKPRHAAPDSELILEAYAVWGPDCVQHLRGDFAFAIWEFIGITL